MRHCFPKSTSCIHSHHGLTCYEPYNTEYVASYYGNGFAHAKPSNKYVKILKYIAEHDGCKRVDVLVGVGDLPQKVFLDKELKHACRGEQSSMFAQLLYIDVIDYDKQFKYHITERGKKVLEQAYQNA